MAALDPTGGIEHRLTKAIGGKNQSSARERMFTVGAKFLLQSVNTLFGAVTVRFKSRVGTTRRFSGGSAGSPGLSLRQRFNKFHRARVLERRDRCLDVILQALGRIDAGRGAGPENFIRI
jgi:hypothetical protein